MIKNNYINEIELSELGKKNLIKYYEEDFKLYNYILSIKQKINESTK